MDFAVGDVMRRFKVSTYDYQGREAYRLAECRTCDAKGIQCPTVDGAATGELVHYYEGKDEPIVIGNISYPAIKTRVMYEPYEGEARRVNKAT